jgi:hypothetical protein
MKSTLAKGTHVRSYQERSMFHPSVVVLAPPEQHLQHDPAQARNNEHDFQQKLEAAELSP